MLEAKRKTFEDSNLTDADIIQCPFEYYQHVRDNAPVLKLKNSPIPGANVFLVSKYKTIKSDVLTDWKTYSNKFGHLMSKGSTDDPEIEAIQSRGYPPVNTMLTEDPPLQRAYRSVVGPLFSPARVKAVEESIYAVCNDLIDRFEGKDSVDFVAEFAVPLPISVLSDMIGLPRSDLPKIKAWADASIAAISKTKGREAALDAAKAGVEMQNYLVAQLDARRTAPQDDALTHLLDARFNGERPLEIPEILSILGQLMVAGHETTTNALAGGLVYILRDPESCARFRADPDLLVNAVDEILRLEASTKGMWRVVTQDTVLDGVAIRAGDILFLSYDAANRDEDMFDNPEACVFDRENVRQHLSFGAGTHTCIGAQLARRQMQIAYEVLLKRLPNLRLAQEKNDFKYLESILHRGFVKLYVEL